MGVTGKNRTRRRDKEERKHCHCNSVLIIRKRQKKFEGKNIKPRKHRIRTNLNYIVHSVKHFTRGHTDYQDRK